MKNHLTTLSPCEEEASDSLTPEDKSLSPKSNSCSHSFYPQHSSFDDVDTLTGSSRKIRKKRNAYDKIDDDKRLQLFDAVQHRGETLKSAAKRLGINYSSAKSILHTFRKEGRILKKSTFDRPLQLCMLPTSDMDISPINNTAGIPQEKFGLRTTFPDTLRPIDFHQLSTAANSSIDTSPSTSMHGLADTFSHLFLESQRNEETIGSFSRPQIPCLIPPLPTIKIIPPADESPLHQHKHLHQHQMNHSAKSHISIPPLNPNNNTTSSLLPLERLKNLDDLYMSYSNSPMSAGRANILLHDFSDSGSRRYYPKEFDSFSDMVDSFQAQNRINEEVKTGEIQIPRPVRYNPSQFRQDRIEANPIREESLGLNEAIENVAADTYRSFMDAQMSLFDALKKASLFNNLLQFQRTTGISPINGRDN